MILVIITLNQERYVEETEPTCVNPTLYVDGRHVDDRELEIIADQENYHHILIVCDIT